MKKLKKKNQKITKIIKIIMKYIILAIKIKKRITHKELIIKIKFQKN